ncbi:MAG: hypothetical protein ACC645_17105, partial [Pirellulales bacterium]
MKAFLCVAVLMIVSAHMIVPKAGNAADWPMWRADAWRSGSVQAPLPAQLHLEWTRSLPPCRVAWPNETRLQFDASYEPVVVGQRMFVASSTDG